MSKLLIGLLGLGGVALVMSGSAAAAQGTGPAPGGPRPKALPPGVPPGRKPSAGPAMPPALVADIEAARKMGDPLQLRALSVRVQSLGFADAANDLLHLLSEIEAATSAPIRTAPPLSSYTTSPGQPQSSFVRSQPIIVPGKPGTVTIPMVLPRAPGVTGATPPDMRQLQAGQLALSLIGRRAGTEDRKKVALFQGTNDLKADGLYGPATALSLAGFGIVPPTPFYWPRGNPIAAKRAYKAALLARAQGDGARKQEWVAAANAVRL